MSKKKERGAGEGGGKAGVGRREGRKQEGQTAGSRKGRMCSSRSRRRS